jgi:tRNA (guanine37-N1)-methyltransferase
VIFDVATLFPSMFFGPLQESILARARRSGKVGVRVHDLRRWGVGPHAQVDGAPYGGGGGMILKPEPMYEAVDWIRERYPEKSDRVILLSPQGAKLGHHSAKRLAGTGRLILLCGRYEGIDERVREGLADEELSVGDVVLTGGELPALIVIDAVSRFVPGVLGRAEAAYEDSFAEGRLDSPYYTRPVNYRGRGVPEVLLSGDHAAIARWRAERSREATRVKRPDLLEEGSSQGAGSARGGTKNGLDP